MKSGLFLPALHPKPVFKKALSCNIPPRHLTQSCSHNIHLRAYSKGARFTQHTLVRNAYVTNRKTTLLIHPVVDSVSLQQHVLLTIDMLKKKALIFEGIKLLWNDSVELQEVVKKSSIKSMELEISTCCRSRPTLRLIFFAHV